MVTQKCERTKIVIIKKIKYRTIIDAKNYYKALILKAEDRKSDHWTRRYSPQTDPCIHGNMIYVRKLCRSV